jgi:hypothetical protein
VRKIPFVILQFCLYLLKEKKKEKRKKTEEEEKKGPSKETRCFVPMHVTRPSMKLGCLASSNISKATSIKKVKGIPLFSFPC